MPNDIGVPGSLYNTKVPSYSENADIQTALRLYHYGEDTTDPSPVISNSIVGHLSNLDSIKVDKTPTLIPASANIDTYVTTGYYVQTSAANANTGTNYPSYRDSGGALRFFAGVLKVVNSGGVVSQEYHMIGDTGYIVNRAFYRIRYTNQWSTWVQVLGPTDVVAITDEQYYKKAVTYTIAEATNAFAPAYFLENLKSANHTLGLDDINRIVSMQVTGGGTITIPTNATVAFPIGTVINVYNRSATEFLTIAGAVGVTLRNEGTIEPYQEASLRKRATDEWVASGPVY
jgi:hypothetical protein